MAKTPDERPPRQHVDELAWMRETKHQRGIDEYLDMREAFLTDPDRPALANDNQRSVPSLPPRSAEIDAVLDELVSAPPLPNRDRGSFIERLQAEQKAKGQTLADLSPKQERDKQQEQGLGLDLDGDRW